MHPAFLVVEAKIFKPRNPLEPDSPISVRNSNANNFSGNPPRQGEEEQLCVPSQSAVPTCQQPQQRESELRPRAPSSQQSRVTMRPFFRTILVQEEARAAELAAAAHPSAPSPPPLSRASAMPSPPSSHQLMINQSFVPLTMVTSGSTLDQRQAQSLVSDEIGAASFASWQQLSKDSMNLAKGETHSDAFFAKQKLGKNEWAQDTIPQRCLFSSFFFVLFLVCIPMKRSLHPHEKDSSPFATPFFFLQSLVVTS